VNILSRSPSFTKLGFWKFLLYKLAQLKICQILKKFYKKGSIMRKALKIRALRRIFTHTEHSFGSQRGNTAIGTEAKQYHRINKYEEVHSMFK